MANKYPEDDRVLVSRARLALVKEYTLPELARLDSKINVFETHDGYRLTLAKVRDPLTLGDYSYRLYAQIESDDEIKEPFAVLAHLLVRLRLKELVLHPESIDSLPKKASLLIVVPHWNK